MDVCLIDNTKTTSKITNKCNYEIIFDANRNENKKSVNFILIMILE